MYLLFRVGPKESFLRFRSCMIGWHPSSVIKLDHTSSSSKLGHFSTTNRTPRSVVPWGKDVRRRASFRERTRASIPSSVTRVVISSSFQSKDSLGNILNEWMTVLCFAMVFNTSSVTPGQFSNRKSRRLVQWAANAMNPSSPILLVPRICCQQISQSKTA